MTAAWDWVLPYREKHFGPPLAGRYLIERVSREAYWELHDQAMKQHFPDEVFFSFWLPADEAEKAEKSRLEGAMGGDKLEDFWIMRDGAEVAMMGCGHQVDGRIYRMWHTNVHTAYRRQGLYRDYIRRVLAYTKDLGFKLVTSEHAPCNNAVIIGKLRAGFRVHALEINAAVGPSLVLRYYHDPVELAAYELRCGMATASEALLRRAAGAAPKLFEQIREGAGSPSTGGQ